MFNLHVRVVDAPARPLLDPDPAPITEGLARWLTVVYDGEGHHSVEVLWFRKRPFRSAPAKPVIATVYQPGNERLAADIATLRAALADPVNFWDARHFPFHDLALTRDEAVDLLSQYARYVSQYARYVGPLPAAVGASEEIAVNDG